MANPMSASNARTASASTRYTETSSSTVPATQHQQFTFPDPIPPLPSNSVPPPPRISLPESSALAAVPASSAVMPPILDIPRPLPLWLNAAYARHIVKGNFMTLSARPKTVDPGEWVAHQVVEHYRNLWNFVRVVHDKEDDGVSICNPTTCPKMSAGDNFSYIWLDQDHDPVELPAYEYMTLMQRWISGKIDDATLFPTNPEGASYCHHPDYCLASSSSFSSSSSSSSSSPASSSPVVNSSPPRPPVTDEWLGSRSGFPRQFAETAQIIFRQIFRVYAHLYWHHFITPFYHLNLEKQLNSCFSHFILTATTLDMLDLDELEPMQHLLDLWAADGTLPQGSRPYLHANLERGKYMMELSSRGP
ncbi:hypothetical protein E4U43_002906 [Claviceps pusilla]|uniref:Uncharacterized protein n=1 Tax=Claviceps pusilla TaxID=123648 RepID=A0A9P7N855_9HYPO|nr:hypothetical protein E4U43_002906 [Claviceps pusilla]